MTIKQHLLHTFLKSLELIQYGHLKLELPDGTTYEFTGKNPGETADMQLHDLKVIERMAMGGDVALCQDYCLNHWDTSDLTQLMCFAIQNEAALDQHGLISGRRLMQAIGRLRDWWRSNTKRGAKKNIEVHYDLGNDFYQLWLDPTMTYSSALFETPTQSLQEAQINKYANIYKQIDGSHGQILEIGCGWGGFAEYVCDQGGQYSKGLTLSREQQSYASKRLQSQMTGNPFVLQDYRDEKAQYEKIVSIEMFEAVGRRYWPTYFKKIKENLATKGQAMIQTITIRDDLFKNYAKSTDLIRTFIFPGGLLPCPSLFKQLAAEQGLKVTYEHAFGHSYAQTLQHWLQAFDTKKQAIDALGYEASFQRLWRFYLASCIGAFKHDKTNVMQFKLEHI